MLKINIHIPAVPNSNASDKLKVYSVPNNIKMTIPEPIITGKPKIIIKGTNLLILLNIISLFLHFDATGKKTVINIPRHRVKKVRNE